MNCPWGTQPSLPDGKGTCICRSGWVYAPQSAEGQCCSPGSYWGTTGTDYNGPGCHCPTGTSWNESAQECTGAGGVKPVQSPSPAAQSPKPVAVSPPTSPSPLPIAASPIVVVSAAPHTTVNGAVTQNAIVTTGPTTIRATAPSAVNNGNNNQGVTNSVSAPETTVVVVQTVTKEGDGANVTVIVVAIAAVIALILIVFGFIYVRRRNSNNRNINELDADLNDKGSSNIVIGNVKEVEIGENMFVPFSAIAKAPPSYEPQSTTPSYESPHIEHIPRSVELVGSFQKVAPP
ncbi:hypothetical protein HK098_006396 [Nowakowskiella sp. JEL0407]|nr:hypothetical protein HK098_006396 [Nowakowskiella sp. JEL0407]